MQLWHNLYRYRGYDTEELGRLFPLLARAVTFYSHTSYSDAPSNGARGASGDGEPLGALHLNATLSPEYAKPLIVTVRFALFGQLSHTPRSFVVAPLSHPRCSLPLLTVAAQTTSRCCVGALMPCSTPRTAEGCRRPRRPALTIWRDMAARLVPYPTDNATGFLIGKDMPLAHGHRHFSHLMMLFPLKALALPPAAPGPTQRSQGDH